MKNIRTILLFSLLLTQIIAGQQPAPAVVDGIVVKLQSSDPLSKVRVELLTDSGGTTDIATTTDDTGKFIFPNVRPGKYRLLASRQAYIRTEYGQRTPDGPGVVFTVTGGQTKRDVRIEMTPGGVISGRVLDRGKPLGVSEVPLVFAVKVAYELGQKVFTNVLSARTDDRGEYHIFWLPPGRYYVVSNINDAPGSQGATARSITSIGTYDPFNFINGGARTIFATAVGNRNIDTEMHVPMFYPGTPDYRDAIAIDVGPGAEIRGIDIQANPVPALHVKGSVTGVPQAPAGAQPVRTILAFYPLNPSVPSAVALSGPVININPDENGSFDKDMISPGTYVLYAAAGNRRARVPIEVRDRDVNGVNVALSPGISLPGRVVIEGSNVPAGAMNNLRISLITNPVVGGFRTGGAGAGIASVLTPPVTPAADGLFTINPGLNNAPVLLPGNYHAYVVPLLIPAGGWTDPPSFNAGNIRTPAALENAYVKSIRFGDRDVLNDGLAVSDQNRDSLVITVGTNAGTMEGRVLGPDKKPFGAATVVLIPEDGLRFRINHKYTSTDDAGHFQMKGIPPGDYKLFAWEQADRGSWQDPEFVGKYESQGKKVHVDEGSKLSIEVTSIAP
jgi:hypothetical protein